MRVLFYAALTTAALIAQESEAVALSLANCGQPIEGSSGYPTEDIMNFAEVSADRSSIEKQLFKELKKEMKLRKDRRKKKSQKYKKSGF